MAEFRFKGKSMVGYTDDGYPDIREECDVYGFHFTAKRYTEVPEDAIAIYGAQVLNRRERKLEWKDITVVEKLRGNHEFEERVSENAA